MKMKTKQTNNVKETSEALSAMKPSTIPRFLPMPSHLSSPEVDYLRMTDLFTVAVGFRRVINLAVLVYVGRGSGRAGEREGCCHVKQY